MTTAQEKRYWRDWSKVRKVLIEMGGFSKAEADAHRHEIHREVFGRDISHKDFNKKEDTDKIFDAFDKILVLVNGPKKGDRSDQPVKRLIYAIEQLGLEEPYLQRICLDQFKTDQWRQLSEDQLSKFRFTCTARANARRKKAQP